MYGTQTLEPDDPLDDDEDFPFDELQDGPEDPEGPEEDHSDVL